MSISKMLLKSNPVPKQRETSQSEYNKLVDTNTKLIDEIKVLEKKYNIMKENAETLAERIDKAMEYINRVYDSLINVDRPIMFYEELLEILKGEDKE